MNIHARINARKLMLAYLYHYCFLQKTASEIQHANTDPDWKVEQGKEPFFDQNFLADLQVLREKDSKEGENFQKKLEERKKADGVDEMPYYLTNFFDQWKSDEIDGEYIALLSGQSQKYAGAVSSLVNQHTDSFKYEEMEVSVQALFLLAYTESQVMKTPKALIINEMVELAKRYADDGAPKVLNGILDKILS